MKGDARPLALLGLVGVGALALFAAGSSEAATRHGAPPLTGPVGRYFRWEEFTRSATATRLGLSNQPPPEAQAAIRRLVAEVLDPLREALGLAIHITSGYRSPAVNAAVGGSPTSRHMRGEAADIRVDGLPAGSLAAAVVDLGLPIDSQIAYPPERGGHLHVCTRPRV